MRFSTTARPWAATKFVLVLSLVVVPREAFEDEEEGDDEDGKIVAARQEING